MKETERKYWQNGFQVSVIFTTVKEEDWRKFRSVVVSQGETITKVLWRAAQEYVEKHEKEGK